MTTKYWNCLGSGAQLPRIPNPTSRAPGVAWHALQHQCVHVLKMTLTQNMSSLKHGMRRLKYDMRRLSCDMRKLKTKIKSSGMMCCLADHGKACPESAVHANRHFQIASIMACLHVVLSQISSWRCDSTHKTMMQHDSVKRSSIAWHAVSIRHIPAADSFNKEKQSLRFSAITTGAS